MNKKKNGWLIISLAALLHLVAIAANLLKFKENAPFHLFFHLLKFFSLWSIHTSILTVLAAIIIFKERKKPTSYFSQLITFLATIYNLVTFGFWTGCVIFAGVGRGEPLLSILFSLTWHFVAPLLTILYFYLYASIDLLRKKLVKTFLFSFICPVFYFFYVWILAKINIGESSSLFPYMEKYPYFIFRWIAEREWKWLVVNFLIAFLVFLLLCSLIIWTKSKVETWRSRNIKVIK